MSVRKEFRFFKRKIKKYTYDVRFFDYATNKVVEKEVGLLEHDAVFITTEQLEETIKRVYNLDVKVISFEFIGTQNLRYMVSKDLFYKLTPEVIE